MKVALVGSHRSLAAVLVLAILGAIAWFAYWTLPQRLVVPGFTAIFVVFFGGLALPYLVTLALLFWRDGGVGFRFASGAALVNAIWAIPLGGLLLLFAGFTMGNRDQEQSLMAVATGALLQIPLLLVAGSALKGKSRREPALNALPSSGGGAWTIAFVLPVLASGGSFLYVGSKFKEIRAGSTQAASNSRAAQETVKALQSCLSNYRESGYPAQLSACSEVSSRMTESSGYRFVYLPSLSVAPGRSGAYVLCAQPLAFRATGFELVVATSSGRFDAGIMEGASVENPPTCASVLGPEQAMAWCAFAHAAKSPSGGYPKRLKDMTACVTQGRRVFKVTADWLVDDRHRRIHTYLAAPADANGRVAGFRIYGGDPDSGVRFIDDQFRETRRMQPATNPAIKAAMDATPALAVPEQFEAGCQSGKKEDCFLSGAEWERKARQVEGKANAGEAPSMRETALLAFARGCELGEAQSCVSLASAQKHGNDTPRNVVRAAQLYEMACALGDATGCIGASDMVEQGRPGRSTALGSPPPPRRASS